MLDKYRASTTVELEFYNNQIGLGPEYREYTVTKSDRFLEGHSKFPPQSQKTFVSDTGKNFTLSKAFFLRLLSGKLFHSGECAFFHL